MYKKSTVGRNGPSALYIGSRVPKSKTVTGIALTLTISRRG